MDAISPPRCCHRWGGPSTILAILTAFVVLLLIDRRSISIEIENKIDRIERIVDDYYKGNMTFMDALTGQLRTTAAARATYALSAYLNRDR